MHQYIRMKQVLNEYRDTWHDMANSNNGKYTTILHLHLSVKKMYD